MLYPFELQGRFRGNKRDSREPDKSVSTIFKYKREIFCYSGRMRGKNHKKDAYKSQKLSRVGENLYRNGEGMYYGRAFKNGKQHKKCLDTHDRQTAESSRDTWLKQIERGTAETPDLHYEEIAKKWLESIKPHLKESSYDTRVEKLRLLEPYFKGKKLRAISRDDVMRWATARSIKIGPRTFNIERETLDLLFRFAQNELGLVLEKNPLASIKKRKEVKAVVVPPTHEQFNALVENLSQTEKRQSDALNLVLFLAYSGCRLTEALHVQWRHVDFVKDTLLITGGEKGTKNMKQRVLPLFVPLKAHLLTMHQEKKPSLTDYIFTHTTSKKALKSASKNIGLPEGEHFNHHDMRHFFCSNAIEAGIDFATIAHWLGHSDGGKLVAGTYGHLRAVHSSAMAKLMTFTA